MPSFRRPYQFGAAIIVAILILFNGFFDVSPGMVGVVSRLGALQGEVYGEGPHLKLPMLDTVREVSIQRQTYHSDTMSAGTADKQQATTKVSLNIVVPSAKALDFFRNYRGDFSALSDRELNPALQETLKAVTAKYTATQLLTQREQVRLELLAAIKQKLASVPIVVNDLSITDFDWSQSFKTAVEATVVAEQEARKATFLLQKAQVEGQAAVVKAKAEAEAIAIQSEAIQKQGGADYVKLRGIEKWDGHMPGVVGGAMPFIDVGGAAHGTVK